MLSLQPATLREACMTRTVIAVDSDPKACEVYRANFPDVPVECRELASLVGELPAADIVLGGPPCQPFSNAGENRGASDERDCIPDFIAAVGQVRPRMFLMENVRGLLKEKHWPCFCSVLDRLSKYGIGYNIQWKLLDAVNFGVPQFRKRIFVWGIRSDLSVRHRWPKPTHTWPPPEPCMFGAALLPGVTVGQALGLDGWYDAQNETAHSADEPIGTLQGSAQAKGGGAGHYAIQSHADPAQPIERPSPSLRSGGNGHDGCCLRIIGGGSNPHYAGDDRTDRDITQEPSTTIPAGDNHNNAIPYIWSDEMYDRHSPASPASPAPTVQAKYAKGGAEGLIAVMEGHGHITDRKFRTDEPSETMRGALPGCGDLLIYDAPIETLVGSSREPIQNWRDKGYIRRLTPDECSRLQSMPDDFTWPAKISKTARYRIIGNGIASLMMWRLSQVLRAADPESRTVMDLFCGGGLGACGWHGRFLEYHRILAAREMIGGTP